MRSEYRIGQSPQYRNKFLRVAGRFFREDVDRTTRNLACKYTFFQSVNVYHMTAAEVDKDYTLLHRLKFTLADHTLVRLPPVDMQGYDIGLFKQLVKAAAFGGVAQRKLFLTVVVQYLHPQRFRQHRQLRADIAIANDAELLSPYFEAAAGRLVPPALMHLYRLMRNVADKHDHFCNGQFYIGPCVAERCVEDGDSFFCGRLQVDLVGANAKSSDGHEPVGVLQYPFRYLRF